MITIKGANNQYYIHWTGDYFHELLDLARSIKGVQWNPSQKIWIGSASATKKFMNKCCEYEVPLIDDITERNIENDCHPKPETRFFRDQLDQKSLIVPPLKPYQIEDIQKGISQSRVAYYLEMGLGKSYIVINVLNHLFNTNKINKAMIVCPSEGLYNFRREFLRFSNLVSEDDIVIANTQNREPFNQNKKIIILTYRTFLMLCDDAYYKKNPKKKGKGKINYRSTVLEDVIKNWGTSRAIVLDESHSIKNLTSKQSKVLHMHKHLFDFRYIMTGTPTPNDFTEIYSQMTFLDKSLITEDYYEWLEKIANVGNRFSPYAVNYIYKDKQAIEESKFKPWIIRRKLTDEIEMPDLYEQKIYFELPETQKQIYQLLSQQIFRVLKEEDGEIIPKQVVMKFPYLSQALDDPILLKDKISPDSPVLFNLVKKWKIEHSMKFEMLSSLLEKYIEDQKQKVVVFDYHPKILQALYERFSKYNPLVLHGEVKIPKGQTKDEYRDYLVETFKKPNDHKVFFASSKMLTVAVNLTEIRRVIYYSRDYSYLTWSQTKARFYRNGQTEPVIINPFIQEKTIDILLDKALEEKHDLDSNVFKSIKQLDSIGLSGWKDILQGDYSA